MKKFTICAFAILAVVNCEVKKTTIDLPPDIHVTAEKAFDKCCPNKEDLSSIKKLIYEGGYRDDPEFKRVIHCVMKETGHLKEDGRLIIDKAAAVFPDKEMMKKIMTECDKDMGNIPVENAYKSFKCYQDSTVYKFNL